MHRASETTLSQNSKLEIQRLNPFFPSFLKFLLANNIEFRKRSSLSTVSGRLTELLGEPFSSTSFFCPFQQTMTWCTASIYSGHFDSLSSLTFSETETSVLCFQQRLQVIIQTLGSQHCCERHFPLCLISSCCTVKTCQCSKL